MRLNYSGPNPELIGFLLLPRFSMMAFFSAVEPLRIANRISGRPLFEWMLISENGGSVTASNGMTLLADQTIEAVPHLPSLALCSGFDPERYLSPALVRWLRRLSAAGCVLGGLDTGCFVLAAAGLLNGERVTLHWESLPSFKERFPAIATSNELLNSGRGVSHVPGGTAAMDMALDVIARRHGQRLAIDVSEQLVHERMRTRHDQQRMTLARRLDTHNARLVEAVDLMERHLETPLSLADVARRSGVSLRQLQRIFEHELRSSPRDWYLGLRLERAYHLLTETDLDVLVVGLACGFASSSSFSRAFRQRYGSSPRQVR